MAPLIGLVCILSLLGFAFYGFVIALTKLFNPSDSNPQAKTQSKRSLEQDVMGTSYLLNYLLREKRISRQEYHRLRDRLEKEFAANYLLSRRVDIDDIPESLADHQNKQVAEKVVAASPSATGKREKPSNPASGLADAHSETPTTTIPRTDSFPPIVAKSVVNEPSPSLSTESETNTQSAAAINAQSTAASKGSELQLSTPPWDEPEQPPKQPRKTFSELMSGFMLEKNIRWGELASGILIVGSAVGLITSLREELRNTIPYFSSLLFMLVTAAIHGAGVYTLKKWTLRNTSRGTLLIGLLLIPLNFLAASLLAGDESERRALSDPWLWAAVSIGTVSFSLMAWNAGKCLFRRGQFTLTIALLGSGIAILIVNRAPVDPTSMLQLVALTLPILGSFLVGATGLRYKHLFRSHWDRRKSFRLLTFLGIAAFAFVVCSAFLLIRNGQTIGLVALSPALCVVGISSSWIGAILSRGQGARLKELRLTTLSIQIFGGVVALAAWVTSFANTSTLLICSVVIAVLLFLMTMHRREPRLLPFAWLATASSIFCLVNLALHELAWNSWVRPLEVANTILSGQTGITFLIVGLSTFTIHRIIRQSDSKFQQRFKAFGTLSGMAVLASGCLIALIASFVHPQDQFDNTAASALLAISATLSCCGTLWFSYLQIVGKQTLKFFDTDNKSTLAGLICSALVAATFAHSFAWNPQLSAWLNNQTFELNANWSIICVGIAVCLSLLSIALRAIEDLTSQKNSPIHGILTPVVTACVIACLFAFGSSAFLIREYTGIATGISLLACLSWLGVTWAKRGSESKSESLISAFWIGAALTSSIGIVELLSQQNWVPSIRESQHWLLQIGVLAIGLGGLQLMSALFGRSKRLNWLFAYDRTFEPVLAVGLAIAALSIVITATVDETLIELFASKTNHLFSVVHEKIYWMIGAIVATTLAVGFSIFKRPNPYLAIPLVLLWYSVWLTVALQFSTDKAVASAVRWTIPIGGLVCAFLLAGTRKLLPLWSKLRNQVGFEGRSVWSRESSQVLVNIALALVGFTLLSISTTAIVQVVMHGGGHVLGGPVADTIFGDLAKDVSYGVPVGILVTTCLFYAITEKRPWLATAGSLVFQYCVGLSIILLITSPHPRLASSWFINILQAVSIGMTLYGFAWWFFRDRIGTGESETSTAAQSLWKTSQLKTHVSLNGLLLTSLAVLVTVRIAQFPDQPAGWVSSVGSLLGLGTLVVFSLLVYFVWNSEFRQTHRPASWLWLTGWFGFILVAQLTAFVDRHFATDATYIPWISFNVMLCGTLVIAITQLAANWFLLGFSKASSQLGNDSGLVSTQVLGVRNEPKFPMLATALLASFYCFRAMLGNPSDVWWYVGAAGVLVFCTTAAGIMCQSALMGFFTATVGAIAAVIFVDIDPQSWFTGRQPYVINAPLVVVLSIALAWLGIYVFLTVVRHRESKSNPVWMPNCVLILAASWLLLASFVQMFVEIAGGGLRPSILNNPTGGLVFLLSAIGIVTQLWNDSRRGVVIAGSLLLFSLAIFCSATLVQFQDLRQATAVLAIGICIAALGICWKQRSNWDSLLTSWRAPNIDQLKQSMQTQFPILGTIFGLLAVGGGLLLIFGVSDRPARFLAAMSPFGIAVGFGCWSDVGTRRWLQSCSLVLLTLGAVFVSWAEISSNLIRNDINNVLIRTLIVLAGAMFVYGGLVTRWVREGDSWLRSLKEMSVATCIAALICFVIVVLREAADFVPDIGCGTSVANALTVALVVIGMVAGLINIAVRPKNDPFSLSLQGRMGYVYAAQAVAALLVLHIYFSMPNLFRFGLKDYWPYIAMLISFGGVGVSRSLRQRKLEVLAQPLFTTASMVPIAVAGCTWIVDSKADQAVVFLGVGMAYLLISYLQQSMLLGSLAIVFGNLAIWMFYGKFQGLGFADHPQLWIIPPALCVLTAAQLSKQSFNPSQLAAIRYLCVAVIYISSTSEILISGLGETLWPPMVLATLAVGGIFAGIMVQVRAYLYLGSFFLLTAMVAMVSHAHQRFDHVWPWWAFGITLGISILVLFGLFEKRRNDMKAVVGQLQQWDL